MTKMMLGNVSQASAMGMALADMYLCMLLQVFGYLLLVPHIAQQKGGNPQMAGKKGGKLKVNCGCAGVPWRDMAEDGSVDDGRDNFYYVLNNVITGNHLPCPLTVDPILPELPQVNL